MPDTVIPIHGGPRPGDPDPEIVEMLEGLLARARVGGLTMFAYAAGEPSGAIELGWKCADTVNTLTLGGAICELQEDYFARMRAHRTGR